MKQTPDLPEQPEQLDLPEGWSIDYRDSTTVFTPPEGKVLYGQQAWDHRTINRAISHDVLGSQEYKPYMEYPVVNFAYEKDRHGWELFSYTIDHDLDGLKTFYLLALPEDKAEDILIWAQQAYQFELLDTDSILSRLRTDPIFFGRLSDCYHEHEIIWEGVMPHIKSAVRTYLQDFWYQLDTYFQMKASGFYSTTTPWNKLWWFVINWDQFEPKHSGSLILQYGKPPAGDEERKAEESEENLPTPTIAQIKDYLEELELNRFEEILVSWTGESLADLKINLSSSAWVLTYRFNEEEERFYEQTDTRTFLTRGNLVKKIEETIQEHKTKQEIKNKIKILNS